MAATVETKRDSQVLIVVGSVNDELLDIGRDAIGNEGCDAKLVRMSRSTFFDEFVPAVKHLGIYCLDEIVTYVKSQRRPVPIEFKGIATPNGFIGGILMDRRAWNQLRTRTVNMENIPLWATSRKGDWIELVRMPEEVIAA